MKKRIEELAREIGGFNGNSIVYVAIVNMTLAVNEALELAARVCDSVNNHDNPMTATDCAEAIRKLKDQS